MQEWYRKMSTVNELHVKAVDLAEEAFLLKKSGKLEEAKQIFLEALIIEEKAAFMLPPEADSEPTRSIIFRSAASLAFNSGDLEKADWLIANGLAGYPPFVIAEELKNLYEEVNFQRHLSAKGIILSEKNWLMTLHGNATSYGKASADLILTRVDKLSALYYRTVERLLNLPYRANGSIRAELKSKYGLFIDAFAPASFAISFHVGKPDNQLKLEFPDLEPRTAIDPEKVVDEVMTCFKILEGNKPENLKERFPDDVYYDNFIGLAKQLAPDGDAVKMVGFSVNREGENKPVALRKNRRQIIESSTEQIKSINDETPLSKKEFTGVLRHANSPLKRKYGTVKLIQKDDGTFINVKVAIALMKDVVQPYYEESVKILVSEINHKYYLEEIEPFNPF